MYQEALGLLPAEEDEVPIAGFFAALERVDLLLGLDERNEARRWVTRADGLIATYGYAHLAPVVDERARRL